MPAAVSPAWRIEAIMPHRHAVWLTAFALAQCPSAIGHEFSGPHGTVVLDWQLPNISRVLSSGYGDAFGIEAAVKTGFPTKETIDGRECMSGSYFLFDVADDYAFDIDESVEIEILFHRRRTRGFWISYDRNALAEPLHEIEFPDSRSPFYRHTVELYRARFANRGEAGSDFAIAGLSAMWPGIPDENHRIVVCELKISRSGDTAKPKKFGELKLTVRDGGGGPTPARLGIYDATGRMPLPSDDALPIRNYDDRTRQIFLRATHGTVSPWPNDNRHVFYIDGEYRATLPAGKYRIVASKGPEYRITQRDVVIRRRQLTEVDIGLQRWADRPANGWYSGDDHLHMIREQSDNTAIVRILQAEDVHVGNLLQMGNPADTHFHQYAFGQTGRYVEGRHALVPGVEDPRTALRGHTISLNIDKVIRDPGLYLQYETIFDAYRKQGGLSGYAHVAGGLFNVGRGLALDVPLGAVDFVEVMQDGILETELWYDFLNLGFKLIPTAGSDFPYLGHPGAERNYVLVQDDFSIDAWYERLKSGRTFVTNGPLLDFTVNGQGMGATIELTPGEPIEIRAEVSLNPDLEPLDRLELIVHGDIAAVAYDISADNSIGLHQTLTPDGGLWLAVRAYGKSQTAAHSAPIYVVSGGQGFENKNKTREIVNAMLARLDEFETLEVDPGHELEVWAVGDALEAMLKQQRSHILASVEKARRAYAKLAERSAGDTD